MTRERAKELAPVIAAYGERKMIQLRRSPLDRWEDLHPDSGTCFETETDWRIKPEPKTRPMTRGEVLYMVTTTPGMVARYHDGMAFPVQHSFFEEGELSDYEYAIIDKQGNPVDGWHKFEVVE